MWRGYDAYLVAVFIVTITSLQQVGRYFLNGRGVPKSSKTKARKYFEMAAEQGNENGIYALTTFKK